MRKAAVVLGWIAVVAGAAPGAGARRPPYPDREAAAAVGQAEQTAATTPGNTIYVDEKCRFLPEPATAAAGKSPHRNKEEAVCHVESTHRSDHWEQQVTGNEVHLDDVKVREQQYVLHNGGAQPELFVVEETVPQGWTIDSDPLPENVDGNTAYFHAWVQPGQDVHLHVGMRHTRPLASKMLMPLGPGTAPPEPAAASAPPALTGGAGQTANGNTTEADQETALVAPVPTLQVTAREVLLDLTVTDAAGHPITGLRLADIKVSEDGAPQKILRLDEHQPMGDADLARLQAAPALPPNTFTNFTPVANTNARTVILLDAQDTPLLTQQYLREQLIAYLKQMKQGAQIAIFQLTDEIRLIQGFTSDQKALLAAAESKRDMPSLEAPIRGNRYQYRMSLHESVRDAMQMMGRYLAGFPGRKSLIWFTADLPLYTGQNPLSLIGSGHAYPFKDTFDLGASADDPGSLADEQTLSRVAVYPVDSRGLEAGGLMERMSRDIYNLGTIADATGGKFYFNNNDLKGIIAEVVNDGSNYYTLSYAPSNQNWNGEFRHIKVTVNRPGARVQNREGYYANNRGEQEEKQAAAYARRMAKAAGRREEVSTTQSTGMPAQPEETGAQVTKPKGGFEAAMLLGAIPPTEIVFTASLAPAGQTQKIKKGAPMPPYNFLRVDLRGKPFRMDTILFQTDIHQVRLTQTPDGLRHGTVDFVTVVYDQDGMSVNALRSTAELNVSESTYRSLLRNGLPVRQEIAVPVKGNYFLRLGVHDEASDRIGALEIPVDQIRPGVAGRGL